MADKKKDDETTKRRDSRSIRLADGGPLIIMSRAIAMGPLAEGQYRHTRGSHSK